MFRSLRAAGVLAAIAFGAWSVAGSVTADAASGCAGSLIESQGLKVGGKKVGELDVYYNKATGKNCAKMTHAGSTWGKRLKTRVWVGICSERKPGGKVCHYNAATDAVDVGNYAYYAGPATTKASAKGRCIAASGYLWIGGKRHTVSTHPWVGHCGS
jgi:hypothetical protein